MTQPLDALASGRTILSAHAALRARAVTSAQLVDESLAAIAAHGAATNAFIRVNGDAARASALVADDELRRGLDRGPLHGIPISIKDLIDVAGEPTTAASRVRTGHVAVHDAPAVTRMRAAGAVLIGKTNLHEFALGTTSEESAFGAVRNPLDLTRSAGGSSGGSAAAVATGMGLASLGTDTGGSIRIPASCCGVVGLKPSLGEVPTEGVVPLSPTLDHVGPIARTVRDAAYLWSVLIGQPGDIGDAPPAASLSLGVLDDYFMSLLDADVRHAFSGTIATLRAAGVELDVRSVAGTDGIVGTYVDISLYEAARWHAATLAQRADEYQPNVRARLEAGRDISAERYHRALELRGTLGHAVDVALYRCHALALPTLPIVAPKLGATDVRVGGDHDETIPVRAAMLRLTQLFNITGHPAISLPIRAGVLPTGLQLVGRRGGTAELLAVAHACERVLHAAHA